MTVARIDEEDVVVAETGDRTMVGFASWARGPDGSAEITNCFVEPTMIGTGIGGLVMAALLDRARAVGIQVAMIDSDPWAEGFYLRLGFVRVGEAASGSIPGRLLPRLRLDL